MPSLPMPVERSKLKLGLVSFFVFVDLGVLCDVVAIFALFLGGCLAAADDVQGVVRRAIASKAV